MTTMDRATVSDMLMELPASELRTVLTALQNRHGTAALLTILGQLCEQDAQQAGIERPVVPGGLPVKPSAPIRRRVTALRTLAAYLREGGILARRHGL